MLNSTEHEISTAHKNLNTAYEEVSCFKSLRCCIKHAKKCKNVNNCLHFNIYEQDFCAQLSWAWKKFYSLGASSIEAPSSHKHKHTRNDFALVSDLPT